MNQRSIVAVILASQFCFAQNVAEPPPSSEPVAAPPVSTTAPVAPDETAAPPVRVEAVAPRQKPQTVLLREGSEVHLKFAQSLSSKTAVENDPVKFVLAEDLIVDGVVVAKAGAYAVGSVSHVKRSGMMGKGGELSVQLSHVKCGERRIRLRGSQGREGEGKEGTAVALTMAFGVVGLFKHGKNVEVKEGTPIDAYVDQDYELPPDADAAN